MLSRPRLEQYFTERPALLLPMTRALDELAAAGCADVGLSAGYDAPEYLLRALARGRRQPLRLRYIRPPGPSARLPERRPAARPCGIVVLAPPPGWSIPEEAEGMRVMFLEGPVGLLLLPAPGGAGPR